MDLLEYQGKQLFARHGLEVSPGRAVRTVEDAALAADEVGYPVVVKAQVLIGGRGKAGGVKLAADELQAREHASNILGMDIRGHVVRTLWIEHASDIATEYYASVLLDRSAKAPLVMFSVEGGVEIEQVAQESPEKLVRYHPDALKGLQREEALRIAREGGADADVVEGVAGALLALYEVWVKEDATLAEINPLIVTPERQVRALDAKVSLDGNALYRHPENQGLSDAENEDPIERRAREQGVQYVKLDGDIGILGNGAGLVMSTLDVVAHAGGRPANFLDAGGGSDAAKIKQAVELILENDAVKAVLFNIFGGITRCDEVARGLIAAFEEIGASGGGIGASGGGIPFVVRLDGTNDVAGRELLAEAALPGVHPAGTMNEAAELVVELAAKQSAEEAGWSPADHGRLQGARSSQDAGLDAPLR
jgi:succinyl-CoA synthetase beta subunit